MIGGDLYEIWGMDFWDSGKPTMSNNSQDKIYHAWLSSSAYRSNTVWYLSIDGTTEVECSWVDPDYAPEKYPDATYKGQVTKYLRGMVNDPREDAWLSKFSMRLPVLGREREAKEEINLDRYLNKKFPDIILPKVPLPSIKITDGKKPFCFRAYTGAGACTCGKCKVEVILNPQNTNPFGY